MVYIVFWLHCSSITQIFVVEGQLFVNDNVAVIIKPLKYLCIVDIIQQQIASLKFIGLKHPETDA